MFCGVSTINSSGILGCIFFGKVDERYSLEALFYADPDLDITDEVTALLDLAASKSEE